MKVEYHFWRMLVFQGFRRIAACEVDSWWLTHHELLASGWWCFQRCLHDGQNDPVVFFEMAKKDNSSNDTISFSVICQCDLGVRRYVLKKNQLKWMKFLAHDLLMLLRPWLFCISRKLFLGDFHAENHADAAHSYPKIGRAKIIETLRLLLANTGTKGTARQLVPPKPLTRVVELWLQEWFPVSYDKEFYNMSVTGMLGCWHWIQISPAKRGTLKSLEFVVFLTYKVVRGNDLPQSWTKKSCVAVPYW